MIELAGIILLAAWFGCGMGLLSWAIVVCIFARWRSSMKQDDSPLEHLMGDECWCNPTTSPIKRADGSVSWMIVHRDLVQELIDQVKKAAE